jgi:LysM repeat protein
MNWLSTIASKVAMFAIGVLPALFALSGCGQIITLIPTTTPMPEATATFVPPAGPTLVATATPAPFTPPPTPTPTATPAPTIYTVVPGDTLGRIATQFGISVAALQEENNILDPRTLQPGQQLVIPPPEAAGGGPAGARPTPTPITFAHQKVHFSFTPLGGLWVLGEVENTSAFTLEQVRVGVRLLNEQQETLAEEEGLVLLNLIEPGRVAPFAILFEEAPKKFASYLIYPLSGVPAYEGGYYQNLAVEDLTSEGERYTSYTIQGTVRNTGQEEAIDVQIILTAYDPLDRVIATRKIVPDHNVVAAGGATTFTAILVPFGGPVERIHAAAQGRRYPAAN